MLQRRSVLAGAALAAWLPAARAQTTAPAAPFPSRPVRIVPFGTAGGPIDTLARAYGDKLAARCGIL